MDLLRVMAMLDLLNGTDSRTRYPQAPAKTSQQDSTDCHGRDDGGHGRTGGVTGNDSRDAEDSQAPEPEDGDQDAGQDGEPDPDNHDDRDDTDGPQDDADDRSEDDEDEPGDGSGPEDEPGDGSGPGDGGRGDGGGGDGPGGNGGPDAGDGLAANVELTIPLTTAIGLAQRAGEAHGLGVLDPGLARRLAAEAARNPHSTFEIIVTDPEGRAIGYGKATPARRPKAGKPPEPGRSVGTRADARTSAAFTPAGPGPPGGYGTWTLTLDDVVLTVKLAPIPDGDCDHRHQSAGYQPSDTLRRLVRIRDGECVLPVCVRHPRSCEWDHGVPWPAGRTCSCNGAMRCPHDHRLKHSPGWKIQQLPGGYHRWTTPSGRTFTKGPRKYPV
jgi:hypothetical protein